MVQSQGAPSFTIGTLAAVAGVSVETIRYYQRNDLLQTPPRGYGIRRYGAEDLRQLRFIRRAQKAGFTLKEIKELLILDGSRNRRRVREMAASRLAALDEKIAELRLARDALSHLTRACSRGKDSTCPILKSFEV